ncbi:hypothetical protein BH10PSE19_BH10PSE19_14930 [soil metagenome]
MNKSILKIRLTRAQWVSIIIILNNILCFFSHTSFAANQPINSTSQLTTPTNTPHHHGDRLSLNFQDIKVRAVLQLLAEFSHQNIVMSDSVQGNVTLCLHDIPWYQALDIILKSRGLEKRLVDGVAYIAPAEELANRDKQALAAKQQIADLEPLHSELIQLNYANAGDIANLLKSKGNTLLSTRGSVSVDDRTNILWVQELPVKLNEIRQLVRYLDFPVKQVLIETRVVNININYEKNLGIKFGLTKKHHMSGTLAGADDVAKGMVPNAIDPTKRLNVDLPANNIGIPGGAGSFGLALAKIGGNVLLDLELSALESQGEAKMIASPRLITAEQKEAVIETGEEIPYQEATSSGATSVEFKKAVLSLRVTPQITPNNKILLKLKINQDKRGVVTNGIPSIDTRSIESFVLVENGQTIVLGGVYQKDNENRVQRIPILGSLPVIGVLFRHTAKVEARQELLIFVTPKIITQPTRQI